MEPIPKILAIFQILFVPYYLKVCEFVSDFYFDEISAQFLFCKSCHVRVKDR